MMKFTAKFLPTVLPVSLLPILLLLAGCQTSGGGQTGASVQPYVPKPGVIKVFLTANAAPGGIGHARRVYVFPPLLIDDNGHPLGELSYLVDNEGRLSWRSEAPDASGIKAFLVAHLRNNGYQPVSFETLSNVEKDHSILVINPYFSAPLQDGKNPAAPFVFARIIVATYPASLAPGERLELVNLETLSFYHPQDDPLSVVRRSLQHAISYMGMDRDWIQELSLQP